MYLEAGSSNKYISFDSSNISIDNNIPWSIAFTTALTNTEGTAIAFQTGGVQVVISRSSGPRFFVIRFICRSAGGTTNVFDQTTVDTPFRAELLDLLKQTVFWTIIHSVSGSDSVFDFYANGVKFDTLVFANSVSFANSGNLAIGENIMFPSAAGMPGIYSNVIFIGDALNERQISGMVANPNIIPAEMHASVQLHAPLSQRYAFKDGADIKVWDVVEQYNYAKVTPLTANHGVLVNYTDAEVGAVNQYTQEVFKNFYSKITLRPFAYYYPYINQSIGNAAGLEAVGTDLPGITNLVAFSDCTFTAVYEFYIPTPQAAPADSTVFVINHLSKRDDESYIGIAFYTQLYGNGSGVRLAGVFLRNSAFEAFSINFVGTTYNQDVLKLNRWNRVVVRKNALTAADIWVNGKKVAYTWSPVATAGVGLILTTHTVRIGPQDDDNGRGAYSSCCQFYQREFVLFSDLKTDADCLELSRDQLEEPTTNLVAYFKPAFGTGDAGKIVETVADLTMPEQRYTDTEQKKVEIKSLMPPRRKVLSTQSFNYLRVPSGDDFRPLGADGYTILVGFALDSDRDFVANEGFWRHLGGGSSSMFIENLDADENIIKTFSTQGQIRCPKWSHHRPNILFSTIDPAINALKHYLNGHVLAEKTGFSFDLAALNQADLLIGQFLSSGGRFNGYLIQFAWWNRILSRKEMLEISNNTLMGNPKIHSQEGLLLYPDFNNPFDDGGTLRFPNLANSAYNFELTNWANLAAVQAALVNIDTLR
jgi:hypothetical protein